MTNKNSWTNLTVNYQTLAPLWTEKHITGCATKSNPLIMVLSGIRPIGVIGSLANQLLESMKDIVPRPITDQEVTVIRQALQHAALLSIQNETLEHIESLKVTGECECGCRSVKFDASGEKEHQLADGVGYLSTGERVDIIIWGRDKQISLLEIVDHEGAGLLPESVCSWEEACRNAF